MKRILFLVLFILGFQGVFAQNLRQNDLYEQNVKSILLVETQNAKGTGIILNSDGTVLTAFHVISNADYINFKTKDGREFIADGYKYLSLKDDIAILTMKKKPTGTKKGSKGRSKTRGVLDISPVKIDETAKNAVGDDIYTISNPIDLDFVFQKGMINRINEDEIQFSAPTSSGSSGGALFNSNGNLIGIIAFQYVPSKAQNINFAIPNSKFLSHIEDKKKANAKNLPWSEFVSEKLSDKELDEFIDYAEKNDNISMLYKYFKEYAKRGDAPSYRYALMGTLAISGFLDDGYAKEYLLNDAKKWFALSILSKKNIEASSYGLLLCSILMGEKVDIELIYSYMKKYPATVRKSAKQLDNIIKCDTSDRKCFKQELFNMCRYLQELTGRGY